MVGFQVVPDSIWKHANDTCSCAASWIVLVVASTIQRRMGAAGLCGLTHVPRTQFMSVLCSAPNSCECMIVCTAHSLTRPGARACAFCQPLDPNGQVANRIMCCLVTLKSVQGKSGSHLSHTYPPQHRSHHPATQDSLGTLHHPVSSSLWYRR